MSWSKDWKNSQDWVNKIEKQYDEVFGGTTPEMIGVKDWKPPIAGAFANMEKFDLISVNPVMIGVNPKVIKEAVRTEPDVSQITIEGNTVRVQIIGDLGLDWADNGWEIYHLPTLTNFGCVPDNGLRHPLDEPNYNYDKQPLLNWMKKVQENYPTAWQMLRLLTPENYKDKGESAKKIIKEWCLSVKVE